MSAFPTTLREELRQILELAAEQAGISDFKSPEFDETTQTWLIRRSELRTLLFLSRPNRGYVFNPFVEGAYNDRPLLGYPIKYIDPSPHARNQSLGETVEVQARLHVGKDGLASIELASIDIASARLLNDLMGGKIPGLEYCNERRIVPFQFGGSSERTQVWLGFPK